jgi:hypothetical protein
MVLRCRELAVGAITGLPRRSKRHGYSITSSARPNSDGGTVTQSGLDCSAQANRRPSALGVRDVPADVGLFEACRQL